MHKDHILFHLDPNSNSLSIQNNAPYSNIDTVLPIEHILHSRPTWLPDHLALNLSGYLSC